MRKRLGSHESMTTHPRKPNPLLSLLITPYFGETMATATMIPAVPLKVLVVTWGE